MKRLSDFSVTEAFKLQTWSQRTAPAIVSVSIPKAEGGPSF